MVIAYSPPQNGPLNKERPSIYQNGAAIRAYGKDVKTLRPQDERQALEAYYLQRFEAEPPDTRSIEERKSAGEYPIVNRHSILGDPSKPDGGARELTLQEKAALAARRHYELWIQVHPTVIESYRQIVAREPYVPIRTGSKKAQVIDDAIAHNHAITWNDLGLRINPMDERDPVLSATDTLAKGGLFTWITPKLLAFPIMESPMPSTTSAESIETLNVAGAAAFIPFDGRWNKVENQLHMARRVQELLINEPVLEGHPDREFLIERAQRLMGLTLKADPSDAVARVERFRKENIPLSLVRIYNARGNIATMTATVRALRERFGDSLNIMVGQVVNATQAKQLEEAGADGIDMGLFEGSICKSGPVSGTVADNVPGAYGVVNCGLRIPVTCEGVSKPTIAFALGTTLSMSKGINGGTYEQPPVGWVWDTPEGEAKNYDGEASGFNKQEGGKTDFLGNPMFVEGVEGYIVQDKTLPTVTARLWQWQQDLATMLIFTQHASLRGLIAQTNPQLVELSDQTVHALTPHHPTQRRPHN